MACATQSKGQCSDPIVIDLRPPEALLEPCIEAQGRKVETNEDLTTFIFDLMRAQDDCAAKVEALSRFYHYGDDPTE